VTWLIHDVSIWRVDRIYPDPPGGPWIASQTSFSGDIWSSPVQWHTASQGTALRGLLTRLGLIGGSAASPPADVAPSASPAAIQPTTRSAADNDSPSGPVWGAAGLALGTALTLAALRVVGRRRPDEAEVPTTMDDVLTSTGAPVRR